MIKSTSLNEVHYFTKMNLDRRFTRIFTNLLVLKMQQLVNPS
jgi:hypothetical protein